MKLRIHGNSVRIRVTRSEVARLAEGTAIEQSTKFSPTSILRTSVVPSNVAGEPFAKFDDKSLIIYTPALKIRTWACTDQISIQATQDTGSGELLKILLEKDFECLHSREDGNEDAFPNPGIMSQTVAAVVTNPRDGFENESLVCATPAVVAGGTAQRDTVKIGQQGL